MAATKDTNQPLAYPDSGGDAGSYRRRLESIGRFLDREELRAVVIIELTGGLLVRATRQGHQEPELFEFVDAEPESWVATSSAVGGLKRLRHDDELFHGGYAAALATLGKIFDLTGACSITVSEGDRYLAVGALYPVTGEDGSLDHEPVADLLFVEDVRRLQAGELPPHLWQRQETGVHEAARRQPAGPLAGGLGNAAGRASAALAGIVSRLGRGARGDTRHTAVEAVD